MILNAFRPLERSLQAAPQTLTQVARQVVAEGSALATSDSLVAGLKAVGKATGVGTLSLVGGAAVGTGVLLAASVVGEKTNSRASAWLPATVLAGAAAGAAVGVGVAALTRSGTAGRIAAGVAGALGAAAAQAPWIALSTIKC